MDLQAVRGGTTGVLAAQGKVPDGPRGAAATSQRRSSPYRRRVRGHRGGPHVAMRAAPSAFTPAETSFGHLPGGGAPGWLPPAAPPHEGCRLTRDAASRGMPPRRRCCLVRDAASPGRPSTVTSPHADTPRMPSVPVRGRDSRGRAWGCPGLYLSPPDAIIALCDSNVTLRIRKRSGRSSWWRTRSRSWRR